MSVYAGYTKAAVADRAGGGGGQAFGKTERGRALFAPPSQQHVGSRSSVTRPNGDPTRKARPADATLTLFALAIINTRTRKVSAAARARARLVAQSANGGEGYGFPDLYTWFPSAR